MILYYSVSTGGFYSSEIHGANIPADAVEITEADHAALLDAQATGKRIEPDANGKPVAVTYVPTLAEQAAAVRADRDTRIAAVAWRIERHARETRLGLTPTDNLAALDAYVQALADVPLQAGFPTSIVWPAL